MSSEIPNNGPQSSPSSPPVQPSTHLRKSSTLKLVVIAVIVVIIVAAFVVVVSIPRFSVPPPPPQPTFTFLSASNLTSVYGIDMTATNETKNLSSYSLLEFSSAEVVKAEMWIYQPSQTSPVMNVSSVMVVGILIMEMNSSSVVNASFLSFEHSMENESGVTTSGNLSVFRYVSASGTDNSVPLTLYWAVFGRYILFMEFYGKATTQESTVFTQQVGIMLQPAKA